MLITPHYYEYKGNSLRQTPALLVDVSEASPFSFHLNTIDTLTFVIDCGAHAFQSAKARRCVDPKWVIYCISPPFAAFLCPLRTYLGLAVRIL